MTALTASFRAAIASLALVGCASTGATYKSGVADALLDRPPYYAGRGMTAVASDSGALGYLPITFQAGATQSAIFEPSAASGTPMALLLEEMNAYLDSLRMGTRLIPSGPNSAVAPRSAVPPDVRFGCLTENQDPEQDCAERAGAIGRGRQEMLLAVGRPSPEWVAWNAGLAADAGAARTLVLTLEIGQYQLRQEGLLGKKVVELGTGHRSSLPWLTSLDTPVSVLQLTGALIDRDGKAIRIGAEGFYPRRTRMLVSAIGGQELLSDEDIRAVRTTRRDDLPGAPLAWKVAMRELVSRVTGR